MNLLTPNVAFSSSVWVKYPSIFCLTQPRVEQDDIQPIDDLWRVLPIVSLPSNILDEKDPDKFWNLLQELESESFKEFSVFALSVLSLVLYPIKLQAMKEYLVRLIL